MAAFHIDKSAGRIREMFDDISPRYDFLNHLLSLNADVQWRRRAAERCEAPTLALDVCCGTGDLALELRRRWGTRVVASDFSGRMARLGDLKARRKTEPVRTLQADTTRLPFPDGTFDAVTAAFGIRNLADPAAGLREMVRVARHGGRIVVLEFAPPTRPLLKSGYGLYIKGILPLVGHFFSRTWTQAYAYLPESIAAWHTPPEFGSLMERSGAGRVTWELPTFGIVAIHQGFKI